MKRFLALSALCLLQACSVAKFAYEHADTWLRWQANKYFDFEGEAAVELDRRIAAFIAWNRAHALPEYAKLTGEASRRMLRGVKREDLEWGYDAFRAQVRGALGAAAAEIAPMLDRLSPEQIAHLEARLAEENRKFARENLQGAVKERSERRVKRNVNRLEHWFGSLSDEQLAEVRRYDARAPRSAELRDRDRKRRQRELLALLRAREASQKLAGWAENWEGGREPAYARAALETRDAWFDLLLALDRTLTAEQRRKAAGRMSDYAATFASLSGK